MIADPIATPAVKCAAYDVSVQYGLQCTVCSVQCTVCSVRFAAYGVQCVVYGVQCVTTLE